MVYLALHARHLLKEVIGITGSVNLGIDDSSGSEWLVLGGHSGLFHNFNWNGCRTMLL